MKPVRHYYHVYASGAWSEPVREHFEALGRAGFEGEITVGLVGYDEDRAMARMMISSHMRMWGFPALPEKNWIEAREGWEQLTLQKIHNDVQYTPGEFAVLYAHTKGARDNSTWNALWRRSMTSHVVSGWESCAGFLERNGTDAVGCHWLTPEEHHDPPDYVVDSPFFGGNFWVARASYLRRLPPLESQYRHQAEEWVGLANPMVRDVLPGWPTVRLCATSPEEAEQVLKEMREGV
jgi:hypothetical protein